MSRDHAFKQVDVFTAVPLLGNPVAVVLDAEGLDDTAMQRFAAWTNLSETTFVLPPEEEGADYTVRIFTPRVELPFAGHPTIGTAHAVLEAGLATPKAGRLVQHCKLGLVDLAVAADWPRDGLSFRLPTYAVEEAPEADEVVALLGAEVTVRAVPAAVNVGPVWTIAELGDVAAIEQLQPDLARLAAYSVRHKGTGLTVFASDEDGAVMVRSFAPADGIPEDPVCGSGNGAVAAYRLLGGQIGDGDAYTASQGRQVGRDGKISVRINGADIHIGGAAVTGIEGVLKL
ncbi:PhzF family phenazine biosynthesis protein [Parasphingopyxis marina]|uniref:PhzF family phenazine biosynthesis protein n=1 Tax=Parasphingopyxis marina TaxID=2761622 RepID=A0A842HW66_9SPHN|nr:PhzF family phenazine biosynthesis protein [Parasphingopyxis marina]MBC2777356.1 PhzF family phenazine biosynthesis protein [Parasphingopyxis marina]